MSQNSYKPSTLAIHAGLNSDTQFGSVVPPIYPSSTFNFKGFAEPRAHDYSRRSNPSRDITQNALAALEGGAGSVLTSSGISALHLLAMTFLSPNDWLIAPHDGYGGSYRLFSLMWQRGFFNVRFIDYNNADEFRSALELKPKMFLIETPSNPLMRLTDIAAVVSEAKKIGALVAADNTFMTPLWQRPLELGCDFVVHSCTKYLNGHSDVIAGGVVSKTEEHAALLAHWANVIGVALGATDCYQLLRGMKTLTPRMERHDANAKAILAFLKKEPRVKKLYHPSLPSHPQRALAKKQQLAYGAMASFELDGDPKEFISHLKLFTLAESLGGVESLIAHPWTMTHAGMSEEARLKAGITPALFRLSIGLEDAEDLIADLKNAFDALNA
jgi:cystathionine gamma-synthase